MGHSPATLRAAAAVQAAESAVLLVATVLVGIDTAAGRSYQQSSGIALTLIGVASVAALAAVAAGLARARRWSRTPALLTQLFFGIVGIYLLQGHRLDWGVTSVVLAVAGFATLLAPPSLRALTGRRARPDQEQVRADQEQRPAGQQQKRTGQQQKPAGQQRKPAGQQQKRTGQQQKPAGQQQKRPEPGRSGR
ncbi:MAG TPA: hypothetical protein VEC76_15340 [Streptosporangiaceae bacterium]|nr:hypothetical protein [Streptosporangiaceae bacterium]